MFPFPEHLQLYESSPISTDLLQSITYLTDDEIEVESVCIFQGTTKPIPSCDVYELSQLTSEQRKLVDYWKSKLILEPNSNPKRYVNVLPLQMNLDDIQTNRVDHAYQNESIQETENDFIVRYRIVHTDAQSRWKPQPFEITYPKWMLRQDQIELLRFLARTFLYITI